MKTQANKKVLSKNIVEAQSSLIKKDISFAPFIKRLANSLVKEQEQEMANPEDFTPEKNKEDYSNSLEPNTPQDQFDIEGVDPAALAEAITSVQSWSTELESFVKFLNDPKTQSLHKLLAAYDRPGSLVKGITRKTSDSITRVAGELAKIKQTLDGFINLAPKKQRDTESLVATGSTAGT